MSSLGNLYPNLPGMLVEFKNGGSSIGRTDDNSVTDSLLLIGTAVDGPVMDPVAVPLDEKIVEALIGSDVNSNGAANGSTLFHAYKQAVKYGHKDIRLMRLSGKTAKATMKAPNQTVTTDTRIDMEAGFVDGNDATVLTLATNKDYIEENTVKVYAKGVQLQGGYVYDKLTGKVTIAKNVCDAGSALIVAFDSYKEVDIIDSAIALGTAKSVTLTDTPLGSTMVVKLNGGILTAANYDLNAGKVTVSSAVDNDAITVTYKAKSKTVSYTQESGTALIPFIAATSEQTVTLEKIPVKSSVVIYVDNSKVLDYNLYTIDAIAKTVKVKKEGFKKGSTLAISYYVTETVELKRELNFESFFGGEIYNQGKVEVVEYTDGNGIPLYKGIVITKPEVKRALAETPKVYPSFLFPTFGSVVDAINDDISNGVYKAYTDCPEALVSELPVTASYFAGGDNEVNLTKDQLFEALSGVRDANGYIVTPGAYQVLENYLVDVVIPVGVNADDMLRDKQQDFAYELAMFCAVATYKNKTTLGMITLTPPKDTSLATIQAYANKLKTYQNEFLMKDSKGAVITDSKGEPIDLGMYISVVAGQRPMFDHKTPSLRKGNPAILAAAVEAGLLPQSSLINKKVTGVTGIEFVFSNSQLSDITGNRVICFGTKLSSNGQSLKSIYVIDGPTSALKGSKYGRRTTMRILKEVIDVSREIADPYIGEANTIENRNALSAALSKRYDKMVEDGVMRQYDYSLVATRQQQVLGQSSLELEIGAPEELRNINTVVGLKR